MEDSKTAEAQPLVEIEVEQANETEQDANCTRCSFTLGLPTKWLCCAYRVRVIGIVALLVLQLPLLLYYYSSSDLLFKLTNAYSFRKVVNSSRMNNYNVSTMHTRLSTALSHLSTVAGSSHTNVTNSSIILMSTSTTKTTLAVHPTTSRTNESLVTEPDGSILPQCPPEPPGLQGRLQISFDKPAHTFEQTELDNPLLTTGGHAKPPLCKARHKVAIVIPFRDRNEHLQYFLQFMHPTLQRQQVDYQIFIVNQDGTGKFNRAKLMNIGFLEALKIYPFECFSFHDVDLVVEDDRSLYWCSDRPRHMSAGVDKFNYVLPYASIFGGVTLLSKEQMEKINGFSNEFWGWGGEDDDVFNRVKLAGYSIVRYPMEIARYKMIRHKREKGNEPNPKRFDLIRKTGVNYRRDGLNSIKYKVQSVDFNPTYTNITVDVMGPK